MPSFETHSGKMIPLLLVAVCAVQVACGESGVGHPSTTGHQGGPVSIASTTVSEFTEQTEGEANMLLPGAGSAEEVSFEALASVVPTLALFAPSYLPAGAKVAESWWPLTELADPQEYEGPVVANPRVLDDGSVPQVEVLFQAPHGWFAVLENFRGDVGETPGQKVGEVGGQTATLYNVNGGMLIQWQYDGLWYGVFARGIPQEELLRVAKGMRLMAMVGG